MKPKDIKVGKTYEFLIPGFKKVLIGKPSGICGDDIYVHIHQAFARGISKYEINAWIKLEDFAAWAEREME